MGQPVGLNAAPPVAELDLRATDPDRAEKLAADLLTGPRARAGRILVLDDAELLRHTEILALLRRSPLVSGLVCVAVGRPADGARTLTVPGPLLHGQDCGLLWAPDPEGHDWRPGGTVVVPRRDGPEAGLHRLREVLRLPEVFDRAAELAAGVPGGVSIPGLRLADLGPERTEFRAALLDTLTRMREPGPAPAPSTAAQTPRETPPALRDGSPLKEAEERAERTVAAALRASRPLSLAWRPRLATERYAELAAALEDLHTRWRRLADEVPADAVPLPHQERLLRRDGVAPPPAIPAGPRPDLNGYVAECLANGATLPGLLNGLRDLEGRRRGVRQDRTAELDRACPPELLDRLRGSGRQPSPEPWLPAAGLAAAALCGLGDLGPAAGFVLALLWTVLVVATVLRCPGERPPDWPSAVTANGFAALAGATAAALVGPLPPGWAAPVAGAALAVAAIGWAWRSRCRRWATVAGLDDATEALGGLRSAGARLAGGWWSAVRREREIADLIRAQAAVDGVRAAFEAYTAEPHLRAAGGVPVGAQAETVRERLIDLIRTALEPEWTALSGDPGTHRERTQEAAAGLLAGWERHVDEHGTLEPPPFAAAPDVPLPADRALAIRDDVTYPADGVMCQLLGSDDLPLAAIEGTAPVAARFAPRAARHVLEPRCPADTVWVRSSRHAGVLRLVPVRPGRLHWPATDDGTDDPEETM